MPHVLPTFTPVHTPFRLAAPLPLQFAVLCVTFWMLYLGFILMAAYGIVVTAGRIIFFSSNREYWQYFLDGFPAEYVASYIAAILIGLILLTLTTTLLCKIRQTQRLRDGIPRNAKTDILVRDHGPKSPRY